MVRRNSRVDGVAGVRGRRRNGLLAIPAKSREPYRLWFEFLKLALQDPTLTVDREYYSEWGEIQSATFDDWWEAHWEELFAVEIGVYQIKNIDKLYQPRQNEIIVRLPLYRDKRETLERVEEILTSHRAGHRLADMQQGKYRLDVGEEDGRQIHPSTRFLRDTDTVVVLLNYYKFWIGNIELAETDRENQTARDYYNWINSNRANSAAISDRSLITMPSGIADHVAYLDHLAGTHSGQSTLFDLDQNVVNRRPFRNNLRKAKLIAANVAQGIFPGRYSG